MKNVTVWRLIAILLCAICLASCLRVSQPPVVVIQFPISGTTHPLASTVTFAGTATDLRDGSLTGASLAWTSNKDGQIGIGNTFTRDDLTLGAHTITLTATNSYGTTASTSAVITISDNAPPTATINTPAGGETFARGEPITFHGEGADAEDGSLTGASLVWSSSVDGTIGSSASLIKTTLSEGTHVIALTATDSEGATSTDTVTLYIQGALTDTCYVYSIPDSGGLIAIEIPQAGQELLYTLTISWEGPYVGALYPGLFWPVLFTQAADGSWVAGPALAIAGAVVSDGMGTNGDATTEDVIGGGSTPSGNLFVLHDDYSGVETDPDWWTFELENTNADPFSNVKLYVFPEATIDPQRLQELVRSAR
jgi:hypothetical protein